MRAGHQGARRFDDRGKRSRQSARGPGQANRPGAHGPSDVRPRDARGREGTARMTTQFAGQVALVTGASRGIGASIALELAARGLKVIGTATTDDGAAKISQALASHASCKGA